MFYRIFFPLDGQEISHAMVKQKLASPNVYKADYMNEVMGKAPENPEISYPEHDMHKMLSFLASKVNNYLLFY